MFLRSFTFTPANKEILELLSKGCYYKEINDKLRITMNTVLTHLQHSYEELHVQSRTAAVFKFLGRFPTDGTFENSSFDDNPA
ncbi:MAG TPA: helix-turn-helix transcriptional regulator [Candidatus Dormibacteraeota bacterium]|nr:helix-turn-helix transcriptional regulator [Candidatus Dormibacteraeota bacterium]